MKYSAETLPRMEADIKKKAGLYTNNTFKGENNFEKAPTLNGVPIGSNDLNGTNYLMVYGTGTPTENAAELQAAYNEAKTMPRYLGAFENYNSTITGILAIGSTFEHYDINDPSIKTYYKVTVATAVISGSEIPSNDIKWYVQITGAIAKSTRTTVMVAPGDYKFGTTKFNVSTSYINIVSLTGNDDIKLDGIDVYADNVFLRGINTGDNTFFLENMLSNLICHTCTTTAADGFTGDGNVTAGRFINCSAAGYAFGHNGSLTGILENCKISTGTFPIPTGAGKIYNCIDGTEALINSVPITIPDGDAANEAVNKGQLDTKENNRLIISGIISQSGTDHPSFSIKRNDTGETITATYASVGTYKLSKSTNWDADTVYKNNQTVLYSDSEGAMFVTTFAISGLDLYLYTRLSGTDKNSLFDNHYIEFEVF